MAKFAVLILAAFAFHAASAGVRRFEQEAIVPGYENELQGYPSGKFEGLYGELETVSKNLNAYFQKALPNDRLVVKALIWQSRELAHYIDVIVEKLEAEARIYSGEVSIALEQIIREFRAIQGQYRQIAGYTPEVYAVSQLKSEFYSAIQRTVAQLEKLIRFVQTGKQIQGDFYVVVKHIVADFLYAFQHMYNSVQYYGTYGEQSPKQLVQKIEELTGSLTQYLQGVTHFDAQRKYAIRQFIEHIEAIFQHIQKVEGTFHDAKIEAVFQQVYNKLRSVHNIFLQIVESKYNVENVEAIRSQLIKEIQYVAEAFEQFVQYAQSGEHKAFFFEILGDYFYAIQHFQHQIASEHQSFYGLYQGAFYGKSGYGIYNHAAAYGKSAYPVSYKADQYYGQRPSAYGKGFYGKYQGYAKYGQDLKQYEIQIQTIIRDFYQALETISFEDAAARQTFVHLVREYVQHTEYIIEKLHQYINYNAESEVYIFQQVAQNLKQYLAAFEQFYAGEYSANEYRTQFFHYIQKIASEFERLIAGVEQTQGALYNFAQEILSQYLTATYDFYRHIENFHQIAQQGYGAYARQYYGGNARLMENINNYPRQYSGDNYYGGKYNQYGFQGQQQSFESPKELIYQIQYIARDLSAAFQNGAYFNQQQAQLFAVHARHFAQIIHHVIDQLEAYEHVDAAIQQVIYNLREVYANFQQLAAYNVFTNVHQFRAQFDNYVQIAVAQIEKLVLIAQEESHGNFYYAIKDVLHYFYYALRDFHYEIEQVAQYGQGYPKYGQQYAYGKYAQQYGYPKYGQQFAYGKYAQQYGYPKYGQQYAYGKYEQQYPEQQYAQQYGYPKYGQQYAYGKYEQQHPEQYEQQYAYGKYAQQYGYPKYGQKFAYGKSTQQYGYAKDGQKYISSKYEQQYGDDKSAQQYGYPKYGQQYASGKYAQQYGYPKYGQQFAYGKYEQQYPEQYEQQYAYGKYAQQYGYPKYGQKYAYGKSTQQYGYAKDGQKYISSKYEQQYGDDKHAQQYGYPKYGQQYGQEYESKQYPQKYNKGYGQEYQTEKYSHGFLGAQQYGKGYQSQYGYQRLPYSAEYNQDFASRAY